MEDFIIILDKDILNSPDITDEEFVVYLNLFPVCCLKHMGDKYPLPIEMLLYSMYGNFDVTPRTRNEIHNALANLIANNFIVGERATTTSYLISLPERTGRFYTTISLSDVRKILRSDSKKKSSLVRFYCQLMGTRTVGRGQSGKVGSLSMVALSDICDYSISTINRYNHELEKLKVIYVRRATNYVKDYIKATNVYGRYEDKEAVDRYAAEHNYGATKCNGNWLRKVSAMYNRYVADSDRTFDAELFSMCKQYNEEMERRQKLQPGTDFIDKKKDLSVFH